MTDFYGNGKSSYGGGRFGLKALVDAMNPLDLFKAIGRSARWLFVGRKARMLDRSYQPQDGTISLQPPQEGSELTQHGTTYVGAGATMSGGRGRRTPDEEGAVLLAHAQPTAFVNHSPPYGSELDDPYGHDTNPRFYGRSPSPYDRSPPRGNEYLHTGPLAPYPSNGPLREQAPMPMPDLMQPPPPYSGNHRP